MSTSFTKDRPVNIDYQLPNLCANCAANSAEVKWRVYQQVHVDTKREVNLLMMGRVKQTDTYRILDFYVGVCKECEAKLKQGKTLSGIILAAGCLPIALGGIGLLAAIGGVALTTIPHSVFITAIVGGIVFFIAANYLLGEKPLAERSYDGKKVTFRNKRYEAAFAKLNPKSVYRDHA